MSSEVGRVQAIVDKAEAWLAKVAAAGGGKTPLKRLRELLHGGLRLGTDVPQVALSPQLSYTTCSRA